MGEHARLSASGSDRWINCPPSLLLEEQFEDVGSSFASEGTSAHTVAELKARSVFFGSVAADVELSDCRNHELWAAEMDRYTDEYVDYLVALANGLESRPYVAIEERLDFGSWVPGGFGTGDCIMVQGSTIHVIDLKYGRGVEVLPDNNSQLMLYGLGAYAKYSMFYCIDTVALHIVQPRKDNFSLWGISVPDLLEFGNAVSERAQLALGGQGEFTSGDHCRFCKARHTCAARARKNVELAGFTSKTPPLISNDDVGKYLSMAADIQKWAADLQEYALKECLSGRDVPGWKAVRGRSTRRVKDAAGLVGALEEQGFGRAMLYKPAELETLGNLEKLVGKTEFAAVSGPYVEKPPGKPTLVVETDRRKAIELETAETVFN